MIVAGFKEVKRISLQLSSELAEVIFMWFVCAVALHNMDAPPAVKKGLQSSISLFNDPQNL